MLVTRLFMHGNCRCRRHGSKPYLDGAIRIDSLLLVRPENNRPWVHYPIPRPQSSMRQVQAVIFWGL